MSELNISSELLQVSAEVQQALKNNQPVVALESTIISHGMPFPENAPSPPRPCRPAAGLNPPVQHGCRQPAAPCRLLKPDTLLAEPDRQHRQATPRKAQADRQTGRRAHEPGKQ